MDAADKNRRSIRWAGFDYNSPGQYFVTICASRKRPVFGEIRDGGVYLNAYGRIVHEEWLATAELRPEVILDEFVIMPDHFYAILLIVPNVGAPRAAPWVGPIDDDNVVDDGCVTRAQHAAPLRTGPEANTFHSTPHSLGQIIRSFKSAATRRVNLHRAEHGLSPVLLWQRNYYERVIRDEAELNDTRNYILENPLCGPKEPA